MFLRVGAAVTALISFITQHDAWNVSEGDRVAAMDLMIADGLTEEEKGDVSRQFLYAKGIMRDEEAMVRKLKFNALLNPEGAMVSPEARVKLRAAGERLRRIVIKGEEGRGLNGESFFQKFVSDHPEWSNPGTSFVVFRDHELMRGKPRAYVERIQLSGLCYMHAPIILQHYLVTMHSPSNEPIPMLDMALYLRTHMSASSLESHIWRNEGGTSESFLESILVQDPLPEILPLAGKGNLELHLRSLGPALISRFKVEERFISDQWQHLGERAASKGSHAMVLVGCRKEGGESRYLMQNWWAIKPFVEVNRDYLISCGASMSFVVTPQESMGAFPTNPNEHVECGLLDVQETYNLER